MNWREYWNELARSESDPQRQVARVRNSRELGEADTDQLIHHLVTLLDLQPAHRLLDLCCGNGLLTKRLAAHCQEVTGVDLSDMMIQQAKNHFSAPNIDYHQGNVADIGELGTGKYDRILLQFSFQYLSKSEAEKALNGMASLLAPGGKIVLGDVPDRAKLHVFYPDFISRLRYRLARWRGTDRMGAFWSEADIRRMSKGLTVRKLEQSAELPYSDYRVDYVMDV